MWRYLTNFELTSDWQFSTPSDNTIFRLRHVCQNRNKYQPIAIVALANQLDTGIEIYNPLRISPRPEMEIIQFPKLLQNWEYCLGIKYLPFSDQLPFRWSISVDMPLYPVSDSVSPNASTFVVTTVQVGDSTPVKILSANSLRKKSGYYNPDSKATVYVDVSSTMTAALPAYPIPPTKSYIDDLGWTGDVYAIAAKGTSATLSVREFF